MRLKNVLPTPKFQTLQGLLPKFCFIDNPPPLPTPYWDRALFLSSIILTISPDTQGLRCHPIGTLPGLFLVTRPWYNTLLYIFTILIDISMKGDTILLHCTIDQQNSFSWFRVKNTFIHSQITKKIICTRCKYQFTKNL